MAALLRHAARRVGGSLVQRSRAAFTTPAPPAERRLLTTQHLKPPRPTKDLEDVMCLIQERKEELYDVVSLMEGSSVGNNSKNRRLLKLLSKQVKPRPDDSQWRRVRASERRRDVARAAVLVSGLTLAYNVYFLMAERIASQTTKQQQEQ